jgi:hypothetical protein
MLALCASAVEKGSVQAAHFGHMSVRGDEPAIRKLEVELQSGVRLEAGQKFVEGHGFLALVDSEQHVVPRVHRQRGTASIAPRQGAVR